MGHLYTDCFEQIALTAASNQHDIWYRYMEDTFTKLHCCRINSLIQHINSVNPHIMFTSEQEGDNKLPFLDTCVHVKAEGSIKATVHMKPTHTDQYLYVNPNQHLQHK